MPRNKKMLLMGKSGSGKTSMRSIIFANYIARETTRLSPTLDVEHSQVRFLGDLVLNLWDCGGQDEFYKSYFERQKEFIFKSVEVLIYVFDIESHEEEKDLDHFYGVLEAIEHFSPDARIFVLIHKMDLVPEIHRDDVFAEQKGKVLEYSRNMECSFFKTSIWDETLYKAWSQMVYSLIPNIHVVEDHLQNFCNICDADEVVLFERATFLVISHATQTRCMQYDIHRFEKISNIIKQFKLSVTKLSAQFKSKEVRNSRFSASISVFTKNTYIMVITSNPMVCPATTQLNIDAARSHFERFVLQNNNTP